MCSAVLLMVCVYTYMYIMYMYIIYIYIFIVYNIYIYIFLDLLQRFRVSRVFEDWVCTVDRLQDLAVGSAGSELAAERGLRVSLRV